MILTRKSKGIPHMEDLPYDEFIGNMAALRVFEATEKIDGSQILFGLDENGFYTSRESKGGVRIYNESDYEIKFSTTYMRSAHKLLESVLPEMKSAGLEVGDQVEVEVLFGALPNVVPYSEGKDYLIFLRTVQGKVNIDQLEQKLNGKSSLQYLLTPYTEDGKTIQMREECRTWDITRVPIITFSITLKHQITSQIMELSTYMHNNSGYRNYTRHALEKLQLNKLPADVDLKNWKSDKIFIKDIKEEIHASQLKIKLEIKEKLLNHFVRGRSSAFGPSVKDGGWIEGVVLSCPNYQTYKLVDKDTFGIAREKAWAKRNDLTEGAKSIEGPHSFVGNLQISLARALGHPQLGTIQAKSYLRKIGLNTEERLSSLSIGTDLLEAKGCWIDILENQRTKLDQELDKYEKETINSSICLGEWINIRTLESFAQTFQKINELQEAAKSAKGNSDLIKALVGKQLNEII
jgi:DNA-binding transcriptional MerR regulator